MMNGSHVYTGVCEMESNWWPRVITYMTRSYRRIYYYYYVHVLPESIILHRMLFLKSILVQENVGSHLNFIEIRREADIYDFCWCQKHLYGSISSCLRCGLCDYHFNFPWCVLLTILVSLVNTIRLIILLTASILNNTVLTDMVYVFISMILCHSERLLLRK